MAALASRRRVEASKVFAKKMAGLVSKRMIDTWTVLPGIVLVQTFLVHVMHLFRKLYKNAKLFEKCRYIPLSKRFENW